MAQKKAGDIMPTAATIERDKTEYYMEMKKYLQKVKKLTGEKAKNEAKQSLLRSGIIDEDGQLAEIYREQD